ncbi:hypothetical protein [Micromonospora carbonacea]|uniref:Uncharacterized protein n=1 Tax=Micromonospora carbonacea TaxID=47853 RepID=A0A7H8XHG1_9ACTN|nr:hypothetical protein [Micromonospora carbonacea]MBB5828592.1 hypothetical protein [Micromonospora carbonacea]QLD23819.1 hypothetical protein HXZ27_06015 [Micromonospora carbonacea]
MSVYAVDDVRRELLVVWPAVVGWGAQVVGQLRPAVSAETAGRLSGELTRLSHELWGSYVRPAENGDDEQERWGVVLDAVQKPNLPDLSGQLLVSYDLVEEAAHRLGRVLHEVGDAALTGVVVAEVRCEVEAVRRAGLGGLSGRAVQAASLDRVDASPVQVSAVDQVLRADPFGGGLLSVAVDPAAACVAAAHWLAAAAVVAGEASGNSAAGVFAEADDIEAVSVEVPALVVGRIVDDRVSPRRVVMDLLRAAVAAGEGVIVDPEAVAADYARIQSLVAGLPAGQRAEVLASEPVRATLLDPRRPARDLLEHLLDGIASCRLLFTEYADDEPEAQRSVRGETASGAAEPEESEFVVLVREEAEQSGDRLS